MNELVKNKAHILCNMMKILFFIDNPADSVIIVN